MISTTSPTCHRLHATELVWRPQRRPALLPSPVSPLEREGPFVNSVVQTPSNSVRTPDKLLRTTLPCSHSSALTAKKTCTEGGSANPLTPLMACFANLQLTLSFPEQVPGTTTWHVRSLPSLDSVQTKRLFQKHTLGSALPCLSLDLTALFCFIACELQSLTKAGGTCTVSTPRSPSAAFGCAPICRNLCLHKSQKRANM